VTVISSRQLAPQVGRLADNCELSVLAVQAAVDEGVDIIVLPELVTSGYVFADRDEARAAALTPDAEVFGRWSAAAGAIGAVVVGGFAEAGADGDVYDSALVVDGSGVLAVYRKTHLWDREKLFFTPGADRPPVVATAHGRIGVLICYDAEFPEMIRTVALAGADLLAVPTNWPWLARPAGERPPELIVAMAGARVNRLPIAMCDRTGTERGVGWTAGSAIIDEQGWPVAEASHTDQPVSITADIDLSIGRSKRLGEFADAIGDRRPELYGALLDPH
jgi:predicted amidohydrolase